MGAEVDLAVGPIGRSGSGGFTLSETGTSRVDVLALRVYITMHSHRLINTSAGLSHMYSYSQSRGLFAGVALDGSVKDPLLQYIIMKSRLCFDVV